ncbi:MAG TPA: HpsJ family protein [Candidatus Caenarcaniphilales bacterium]
MSRMINNAELPGSLFRLVGYGLLVLALFDVIDIFVPSRFMNAVWELQMVGSLVERAPVPLLGLMLVFVAAVNAPVKQEKPVLQFLSWTSLLVGILFLLLIPMTLSAAWRINDQTSLRLRTQYTQQMSQVQQLKGQLSKATATELETLLSRQGRSVNQQNTQELKQQFFSEITAAETRIKQQSETAQTNARQSLIKNFLKWNLGALVCSVLFLQIWNLTRWVRRASKFSKESKG